jgi:outer membrane protein assembly factor BamB
LLVGACGGDDTVNEATEPAPAMTSGPATSPVLDPAGTTLAATTSSERQSAVTTADSGVSTAATNTAFSACAEGEQPAMSSFNSTTGAEEWTTCTASAVNRFVVGADDERVYVMEQPAPVGGGEPGQTVLIAIDPDDGDEKWQVAVAEGGGSAPPGDLPAGEVIVVARRTGPDAELVAIDSATGATRWSEPMDQYDHLVAVTNEVTIVSGIPAQQTVVTADENGQFPPPAGELTGYDPVTGTVMWTTSVPLDNDAVLRQGAASDGQTVVIGSPATVALDARTGEQRWTLSVDLGDAAIGLISNGVVIMGGQDDDVTALSLATGDVVWSKPGSPPYDDVWAVADGAVYLRDGDDLIAYDVTDGAERWRVGVDPQTYTWPWLAETGSLYTMWWNLEARSPSDGTIRWTTDHPTGLQPVDDTPRMISLAHSADSLLVTYVAGALGGD